MNKDADIYCEIDNDAIKTLIWNGQRNYNTVQYDRDRMDELRRIKHVIEDIQKGE